MKFENETHENYYGVKEVPNVKVTAVYKDGKTVSFDCDVLKDFTLENHSHLIKCSMIAALMSGSFWTEVMTNNLNKKFKKYYVTAETFRRNEATGKDERFYLLDNYCFDTMKIEYTLSASGNPASPIITFSKLCSEED